MPTVALKLWRLAGNLAKISNHKYNALTTNHTKEIATQYSSISDFSVTFSINERIPYFQEIMDIICEWQSIISGILSTFYSRLQL